MAATGAGKVLVYGGRGALGHSIVQHFKSSGWVRHPNLQTHILPYKKFKSIISMILLLSLQWVGAIDLQANDNAHGNVLVSSRESLLEQEKEIVKGFECLKFNQNYHSLRKSRPSRASTIFFF
jgi:hypothetical protein